MLSSQQIIQNWNRFLDIIENRLPSDRSSILLDFYNKHEDRISMMPASEKNWKHSAFAGGYIDHVLRVYDIALMSNKLWLETGAVASFSEAELTFVALHHGLGKMGTEEFEYYLPNDSDWHVKNMGMVYKFNDKVDPMKTNERSLFILQSLGISLTSEEFMAIKLSDGLYDDSNKFYFFAGQKETKIKSYFPFLLHHSIVQASQIEFQKWLDEKNSVDDFRRSITEKPFDLGENTEIKVKPASKAYKTQKISEMDSVKNNPQLSTKTLNIINNLFKEE
jgi:hypothetical protein